MNVERFLRRQGALRRVLDPDGVYEVGGDGHASSIFYARTDDVRRYLAELEKERDWITPERLFEIHIDEGLALCGSWRKRRFGLRKRRFRGGVTWFEKREGYKPEGPAVEDGAGWYAYPPGEPPEDVSAN